MIWELLQLSKQNKVKRCKAFLLEDVLSFYRLDSDNEQLLKEEDFKFPCRYVGICYDRSVTLIDATNYSKEEWKKVTAETIEIPS